MSNDWIEPSLFPEVLADRPLGGKDIPSMREESKNLLDSLKPLGISTDKDFEVHFGRISAFTNDLLSLCDEDSADISTPHAYYAETEHWKYKSYEPTKDIAVVTGYIEACKLVNINGKFEPALRVVDDITDMGYTDKLVLLKNVLDIETVPPYVSEALIIVANNHAGVLGDYYAVLDDETLEFWSEAIDDYFANDKFVYRKVWAPDSGYIDAWGIEDQ